MKMSEFIFQMLLTQHLIVDVLYAEIESLETENGLLKEKLVENLIEVREEKKEHNVGFHVNKGDKDENQKND